MLHVYFEGKSPPQLPLVEDIEVEWHMRKHDLTTDFVKNIINTFEGTYVDEDHFISKITGYGCPMYNLSTGTKAAIMVSQDPNTAFSFGEVGVNVRDYVFEHLHDGHVYLRTANGVYLSTDCDDVPLEISVNGNVTTNWYVLNMWLRRGDCVLDWSESLCED